MSRRTLLTLASLPTILLVSACGAAGRPAALSPTSGPASASPTPVSASPSPSPSPRPDATARPTHHATKAAAKAPAASNSRAQQIVDAVLAQINAARASAGLPAYSPASGLATSSDRHTTKMADGCGLSHQCAGEAALGSRISAAGVVWNTVGENVGEGGPEPATAAAEISMAEGLTRSMLAERPPDDGHRKNLLSSAFHHIGICVYRSSNGTVWMTQDFSN